VSPSSTATTEVYGIARQLPRSEFWKDKIESEVLRNEIGITESKPHKLTDVSDARHGSTLGALFQR
jgi:hypothetical protein